MIGTLKSNILAQASPKFLGIWALGELGGGDEI